LTASCQEVVAEMVHTKNGSQVVRYFLAYGTAKDRKQIIKLLKPHLERICRDNEAQLVLFTALDVIDDTKMVAKSILTDMAALTGKLYMDANGRRALLYPLIGRNTRHITPAMISALASTDSIRATTSKKDDTVRADEVRQAISGDMLREIKARAEELIVDPGGSLLVVETLLNAIGGNTPSSPNDRKLTYDLYESQIKQKLCMLFWSLYGQAILVSVLSIQSNEHTLPGYISNYSRVATGHKASSALRHPLSSMPECSLQSSYA
jgi:hypothetical protein